MLIAWSSKNPRSYYGLLFLQLIFVIVGALACIRPGQLSINDAEFAIILTRSPICAYCVCLVLPRLFIKTLPRRLGSAVQNLKLLWTNPAAAWNELKTDLCDQPTWDGLCAVFILVLSLALNISVQLNGVTNMYPAVQCGVWDCLGSDPAADTTINYRWFALGSISIVVYECVLVRRKRLRWELMGKLAGERW